MPTFWQRLEYNQDHTDKDINTITNPKWRWSQGTHKRSVGSEAEEDTEMGADVTAWIDLTELLVRTSYHGHSALEVCQSPTSCGSSLTNPVEGFHCNTISPSLICVCCTCSPSSLRLASCLNALSKLCVGGHRVAPCSQLPDLAPLFGFRNRPIKVVNPNTVPTLPSGTEQECFDGGANEIVEYEDGLWRIHVSRWPRS